MPGSINFVQLSANEDLTSLQIVLASASLVVITVNYSPGVPSGQRFLCDVLVGTGAFYRANYDANRNAYTALIAKGIPAHLFFQTPLVVQDQNGNSLPIDAAALPFVTTADEVPLSVTVVAAVVNAASYLPGVTSGTVAVLFGSGFSDTPGIQTPSGYPLPTQLGGTSVTVNGVPAPLLAIAEQNGLSQINFEVPHFPALPEFAATLAIVVNNNGKEQSFYVEQGYALGVFTSLAHPSGDPITNANPAQPGEQITIYWTGGNANDFVYSPGFFIPDGIPAPASVPCVSYLAPQVKIGNTQADVSSCSAAAGLVGIGQLVVTVPRNLTSGDYDVAATMSTGKGNIVSLPVRVPPPNRPRPPVRRARL